MKTGILVFDIGTTSVKTSIFEHRGIPLASVSVRYPTEYPKSGWAEQDPQKFWEAAVRAVQELVAKEPVLSASIVSIGLTGHMNGCLLVDKEGTPTHPALIHSDSRSIEECTFIQSVCKQDEIYRRTGNRIDEHLSLPKLLWVKKHRPEEFFRSSWFLNAKDYLRFRLTGELGTTDYSDASLTGAFKQTEKEWDTELIEALDLPYTIFPTPELATKQAGTLSIQAAELLGLKSGIPVSYGGGDAACATRGAGVSGMGEAYAAIGSSAWISTLSESPVPDPMMRMQHFLDLEGEQFNICGTVQSAGIALDWAQNLFAQEYKTESESYKDLEANLRKLPIGSWGVLFLPYLMGERTPHWDAYARGAYIGLSLSTDKYGLLRSTYEGVAFALADIMHIFKELHLPINRFTLLGGGARSTFWQEIMGEIFGMPLGIHPYPTEATAMGAALAAGISVGLWENMHDAIECVGWKTGEVLPDPVHVEAYRKVYAIYRGVYPALRNMYRQLAEVRTIHAY